MRPPIRRRIWRSTGVFDEIFNLVCPGQKISLVKPRYSKHILTFIYKHIIILLKLSHAQVSRPIATHGPPMPGGSPRRTSKTNLGNSLADWPSLGFVV